MARKKIIAGIDIGTSKINAVVGEVSGTEVIITGYNSQPSYGVKKGSIINMESTVDSIERAMRQAQRMAGTDVTSAVVGISGSHIRGMANSGVVPLGSREVRRGDLAAVLDAATAVVIPTDREVVQIVSCLADGGGYVFNSIHNILAEIAPDKIIAMYRAAGNVRP